MKTTHECSLVAYGVGGRYIRLRNKAHWGGGWKCHQQARRPVGQSLIGKQQPICLQHYLCFKPMTGCHWKRRLLNLLPSRSLTQSCTWQVTSFKKPTGLSPHACFLNTNNKQKTRKGREMTFYTLKQILALVWFFWGCAVSTVGQHGFLQSLSFGVTHFGTDQCQTGKEMREDTCMTPRLTKPMNVQYMWIWDFWKVQCMTEDFSNCGLNTACSFVLLHSSYFLIDDGTCHASDRMKLSDAAYSLSPLLSTLTLYLFKNV